MTSKGQATNNSREDFLYGEFYLKKQQYNEALSFYLSSIEHDPGNSNLNYRVGLCYMSILGEQHKALIYLKKSIHEINKNYVAGKFKNSGAPIEAWLLLGDAYHRKNKLRDASYAYHHYKELIRDSDKEKKEIINNRIVALGVSNEHQRSELEVRFINLGDIINSRFSDYNPVLSGNQMVLVYTQYWESYDRIFMSERIPGGWTEPIDINNQIGSMGNSYTSSISFDGKVLYIIKYLKDQYDIYVTARSNGVWEEMKPLSKINTCYHESSVCISSDGYYLYFASNKPGGEGGFDIYRANMVDGGWGNIINLGKTVNTKLNEEAPYITQNGRGIYFSSNGHESVGNMDIMYSERDETGGWKVPENMGVPINTTGDDLFYTYFESTRSGYLSRDKNDGHGKNDIYRVQIGKDPEFAFNKLQTREIDKRIDSDNPEKTIHVSLGNTILNDYLISDAANYSITQDFLPIYTVQIMALLKPVKKKKFSIYPLNVSTGNDGLYRYTYGEYAEYSKALVILHEIRESGYPDAFIRNISTIQNYSGKPNPDIYE